MNRQSETCAREGIEIDVSTLADRVGACVVALDPIIEAIRTHVMSAERIHADDTTVPVLAKLKTVTGRIWTPFFSHGMILPPRLLCLFELQRNFTNVNAAVP